MYKETIGIVGGFGAYATLDFFGRLLECFPAEKEYERPRIIMDNNFPMPSRVRAILYGEHYEQIVEQIAASVDYLLQGRADKIILVCSTAHAFLPEVLKKIPSAADKIISLTECTAVNMKKENVTECIIVGSEGTLDTCVYDRLLDREGIAVHKPDSEQYPQIRAFIESVKQKNITDKLMNDYVEFCSKLADKHKTRNIILACTELPVLTKCVENTERKLSNIWCDIKFWDPLDCVLSELKDTLK